MHKSLAAFVDALDKAGELVRVKVRVDPILEIAEITDRMSKCEGGGKALLFENTGTGFPVLTNMMGSHCRISMALGVDSPDELLERIESVIKGVLSPKPNFADKLRMLPLLGEMSRWLPRSTTAKGRCQDIVLQGDDIKLSLLPILKCWPHDAERFVTLPLVNTIDPVSGARNVGMYRMQVIDDCSTGMHWHLHKTGERHYREYKSQGRRMPVSVCLGGDPAYTYAATAPMPDNMDEYLLAGFIRNKPVKLVKCITNDIYVPADCDFVIEGYVDPLEDKFCEGPFGDHTGFYSLEDIYPVFHVTAITHRKDAIYPATIVGIPPQEDVYIALATEKIFLAPIRLALQPEIKDLYMPAAGVAHNIAIIDIDKSYAGQAQKVANSLWGAGQMMFNKFMLITSLAKGSAIRDTNNLARLLRSRRPPDDVMLSKGVLDVLDHTTATPGLGGKMMIDATICRETEAVVIPMNFTICPEISHVDTSLAQEWGALLLFCKPGVEIDISLWLARNEVSGVNYIIEIDDSAQGLKYRDIIWLISANADAQRDVVLCGSVLIIDGRTKLPNGDGHPQRFPNIVTSSLDTITKVDSRWTEYGLGDFVPSPSLEYIKLLKSDRAEI